MVFNNNLFIINFIQYNFRKKKANLVVFNSELSFFYNSIFSIMTRLHQSFLNGIITQSLYNNLLNKLNTILEKYQYLGNPMKLSIYKRYSTSDIKTLLDNINRQLIHISLVCGMETISDMLLLLLNTQLLNVSEAHTNLLHFYNRVFVPISGAIYQRINNKIKTKYNDKCFELMVDKKIFEKYDKFDRNIIEKTSHYPISVKYNEFLNSLVQKIQGARLFISYKNEILVINGYFREDPLNISRIGGVLGERHLLLKNNVETLSVPNNFKWAFIEQLSLRDFMVENIIDLVDKCVKAYSEFKKLKSKPISCLVKDFLLSNIERQRTILTLFLLNKDDTDNQSLAYLMYDMISNESYLLKPQPLAEQVFNSLHWSVQKLFNSAIKKIDNLQNSIKTFNEDDIPYEKRIFLLKCDDSIKHKALEKLNELNNAKGDSNAKAQQYIDGILKIPFGIYKEESIIQFMSDYRLNIKVISNSLKVILDDLDVDTSELSVIVNNILDGNMATVNEITNFYRIVFEHIDKLKNNYIFDDKQNMLELSKMKRNQLQLLCENNSLSKTGKKSILINRIIECNKNKFLKNINNKSRNIYENLCKKVNSYYEVWNKYNSDKQDYIVKISKTLDNAVYGLDDAKQQIKRIIAQWINGEMKGYAFGFEGPPGTGKTTLAKLGIAKCLVDVEGNSRPFAFIALGGSSNGSTLEGHNYTYVGSTWGRIVDILMETKCMNPIIYIDELDKISKTEHGKELVGILTHLTDTSQNDAWSDKYFSGVKLDLSKILFIFSYNDPNLIDKILLDRIHRIKTKPLNKMEKIKITQDYLMVDILNTIGFKKGDITIDDENIAYIVDTYTYEAGVRKLKEKLFELIREVNLQYLMGEDISFPYVLTQDKIKEIFIDKDKIQKKKILTIPKVGLVNGLFATASGVGGITIIETYRSLSENRLSLELTGKQGDVMKESMRVAKTVAWNLLSKKQQNKIRESTPYGIHIHCPEAATPKDGPSAGGAITIAILSQMLELPVDNTCAMTGEIDLNGSIHAIGGLYSKIEGARTAGVKKVLIPKQNEDDYKKIINDKHCTIDFNNFEIIIVENIHQVIEHFIIFPDNINKLEFLDYNNHKFV